MSFLGWCFVGSPTANPKPSWFPVRIPFGELQLQGNQLRKPWRNSNTANYLLEYFEWRAPIRFLESPSPCDPRDPGTRLPGRRARSRRARPAPSSSEVLEPRTLRFHPGYGVGREIRVRHHEISCHGKETRRSVGIYRGISP